MNPTMTGRAVIYTRVSTKEQTLSLSLETQLERCLAYCEQEGLEVVRTFTDGGESAKTVQRTAFQEMLTFCLHNAISAVVVFELSRFSRNMRDQTNVTDTLLRAGVWLRSVTEELTDDAEGRFRQNLKGAFNQYDNDRKPERTKLGMSKARPKGGSLSKRLSAT